MRDDDSGPTDADGETERDADDPDSNDPDSSDTADSDASDAVDFTEPDRDDRGPDLGSNAATDPFDDSAAEPFDELSPRETTDIDDIGDIDDSDSLDALDDFDDFDDIDDFDDAFEQMDVGDLGDEEVWDSLDEDADSGFGVGASTVTDASNRGGASDTGHADRTVDKRAYCQQCPHFAAPPEAVCTHEGTEIVEVVDVDEFRVRNCPVVSKADRATESARDM